MRKKEIWIMKNVFAFVLALTMLLTVSSIGYGQSAVRLKYGHANAIDNDVHIYALKWSEEVAKRSNGRIKIEVYPANQLGNIREMMEGVELGTLEIGHGDTSMLSTVLPEMGLLALPFIYKGYDHAEKVIDGSVGQELNEKLAGKRNMRPLGWMWNGFRNFCTKVPITKVADCKNIKMRSPEAKIYMDTFTLLGMKPTPIPWGEVYTAMQTKVVDAMETPPETIYKQGFYKLGKYVCNSRHIFSVVGPMISEKKWQSLAKEDQKILSDSLKKVYDEQRANAIRIEEEYHKKMAADGAVITKFENPQELIDLFTPYWTKYAESCKAENLLKKIVETK